jgi:hypothetical protein
VISWRLRRDDIRAIPPTAAERLEQRRCIGIAVGPRLHQIDDCLLIGLLSIEQRQVADGAELELAAYDLKALRGLVLGGRLRCYRLGIVLERAQRVGHVLEGGDDHAAILSRRLIEAGHRGALLMEQGAAVEDCLRQAAGQAPKDIIGTEQLADLRRAAALTPAESDLRQHVGDGDADLGARSMQLRFG